MSQLREPPLYSDKQGYKHQKGVRNTYYDYKKSMDLIELFDQVSMISRSADVFSPGGARNREALRQLLHKAQFMVQEENNPKHKNRKE